MTYQFMQAHQREFRLTRMCQVLQVSRSGFYAWQHRAVSPRARANQALMERMRVLHQQTRKAYGARKMWHLLNREGLICGRHRVARLRRLAGIVALRRRRYVRTVQARQQETSAIPNHSTNSLPCRPRIGYGQAISRSCPRARAGSRSPCCWIFTRGASWGGR